MDPTANGNRHLVSHVFNVIVMVVCVVALAWMMRELGWTRARAVFSDVGPWLGLILALDLVALCCDAASIHAFLGPDAHLISFWRVLAAQISGRSINILTPGGALGEATKVTMLVAHAPRDRVVSAIVLFNLAAFYLSVAIVLVGVPITLALVDLPHHMKVIVWTGLGVLVPLVIGVAIAVHRGAIGTVLATARSLRLLSAARAATLQTKLAEIDRHLRELHVDRTSGTRNGLSFICASRLCSWSATTILLHAVGIGLTFHLLAGVLSVGVLIGWISSIVPLGMGIADGSNYALYSVLGATGAQGMFVTLVNRARSVTLALLGLSVMAITHTVNRLSISERRRRLRGKGPAASTAATPQSGA